MGHSVDCTASAVVAKIVKIHKVSERMRQRLADTGSILGFYAEIVSFLSDTSLAKMKDLVL